MGCAAGGAQCMTSPEKSFDHTRYKYMTQNPQLELTLSSPHSLTHQTQGRGLMWFFYDC